MLARWNWNKVFFVIAALAAAGVGGFIAVRTTSPAVGDERIGPAPSATDPATAEDEKAIRKTQAGYIKVFNAGDAKALAAFWTPDGEFTDAEGRSFKGRNAIEKEFASFFAESKGVTLDISSDSVRFVGGGVALESGRTRVTRASDGAVNSSGFNLVYVKRDDKWLLASVRESPVAQSTNYERLRELEWLVGNWTAKTAGRTLELSCEWTEKRNFLTRKYSLKDEDGAVKTGLQIIAWDPVLRGIRSWVFDSDGGFGSELWTKDGKRWVLEATAVTREGAESVSVNILTRLDDDSFNWQSVRRSLNQVRLPDTALIKVTRVKAKK